MVIVPLIVGDSVLVKSTTESGIEMKIEGEGFCVDSKGKRHSVAGIGTLPDSDSLKSLQVSGSLNFDEISCDEVKIEGDGRGKSINAKNISVSGSLETDSVEVEEVFKVSGSVKIEKLVAEKIVMESRGGSIDSIKCENIKIFHSDGFNSEGIFSKIFGGKNSSGKNDSRVKIKNIDAEKVELKNCEVEEIKCKDAFIDSNCMIKKLIVSGECEIADDSKVGETVRN